MNGRGENAALALGSDKKFLDSDDFFLGIIRQIFDVTGNNIFMDCYTLNGDVVNQQ